MGTPALVFVTNAECPRSPWEGETTVVSRFLSWNPPVI